MSQTAVELPLYQCLKQVRAAKITGVEPQNPRTLTTTLQLGDIQASTEVSAEWHAKHKPTIGSYYVQYADGYTSCSPAKAFEEGYNLIDNSDQAESAANSLLETIFPETPVEYDWKDRVRQEHAELVIKLDKLKTYLWSKSLADNSFETHTLRRQCKAMHRYRDILDLRIHNF